ncbi:MAG: GntR family transcriptional regulator [Notoacmeibacter sp.]|nr:GntR family transcriptional regulator [Notoacmeibacter sp.]
MSAALENLSPLARPDTLAQRVRTQLKEAVMAGRFSPGQRLTIRSVAGALAVSLTPAREALYNLASEGVLDLRSDGSVYVPELTEERIIELTKIRVALEGLASREAVQRITDSEITKIVALNEAIIKTDAEQEYSELISLNWQFHFSIYRASQMDHLVRMIESCWMMTGSYLNVIYPKFGEVKEGISNHLQIVRALEQRDGERLASAINMDINLSADALLSAIRHQAPSG